MKTKEQPQDRGVKGTVEIDMNIEEASVPTCGIIRPIAATDGYSTGHWSDVGDILAEAIGAAGYHARLVSDADSIAVIHGTIVQNIFDDPIVVCDVSSRNPNVMFELGMRLAFDKPVVIVKDEETNYSFDTGVIEHVPYPKSLHYRAIGVFKEKLRQKIVSTADKAKDPAFSPFLKHFRHISPRKLQNEDVPFGEFIVERLDAMDARLNRIVSQTASPYNSIDTEKRKLYTFDTTKADLEHAGRLATSLDPMATVSHRNGQLLVFTKPSPEYKSRFLHGINLLKKGVSLEEAVKSIHTRFVSWSNGLVTDDGSILASESHPLPK
ncbi:hypothetical protein A7D16_09495 [Xanthomonas nasturtii]|uniref:hypothetical protein n=1 Tax=Xanthomonas nasturtii TaxID=1843581 RepID=UPI0007E428C7|nr:hypothetical protein [Xanthomonas nasturtii]OAX88948.1 hypothetical protein A7D16_09495 [Xanthomonas nasturtii]WVL56251.1 hypothetical protein M3O54_018215 [Xanthomonas nasturtii]